ncbi:MAG: helix-turn-helix transcriptional regulator [Acidobacteria bacterium]|nr:helix-turn-helix transcriptional regulator [Acidobacteriota bacterium]
MDLIVVQEKLRHLLKERVALGTTQKQIAEALGIEQAHVSRFLNSRTNFRLPTLNQLVHFLGIDVEDLVPVEEMLRRVPRLDYADSDYADVPLLKGKLGPGQPFPLEGRIAGYRAFLRSFVSEFHRPLLIWIGSKEEAMVPAIQPLDLVLLDTDPNKRKAPRLDRIYAVSFENGSGLRHCGLAGKSLVLMAGSSRWPESRPQEIPLEGVDILSVVRGEAVWVGREL